MDCDDIFSLEVTKLSKSTPKNKNPPRPKKRSQTPRSGTKGSATKAGAWTKGGIACEFHARIIVSIPILHTRHKTAKHSIWLLGRSCRLAVDHS